MPSFDSLGHHLTRRGWLRVGLLSAFGLGLADRFRFARAEETPAPGALDVGSTASRGPQCILIWLSGGPSHIDTLDPKPEAPSEYRGEFAAIDTAVPGIRISEVYPQLAATMDRIALVRSLTSPEADHDRAAHHVLTGYRPSPSLVYPGYSSVMAKVWSESDALGTLPPSVAIPSAPPFGSSGYLTPAYDPFEVGGDPSQPGFRVRDLTPPDRLTLQRLNRRRAMIERLDTFAEPRVGQTPITRSRDAFTARAYDLLTSPEAQRAFQIEDEPQEVRETYGLTPQGQSCLLARRLIEAGVGFVTVNDPAQDALGWDTHADNFNALSDRLAPPIDQAVASLIRDLDQRGRLNDTLVLMMGEFGRTPRINENAGRDHHGRSNSVLIAGGGVPGGIVVGATDAKAIEPIERPVTPSDLAATVYRILGVDLERRFLTPDRMPVRLIDEGHVVDDLIG